MDNCTSSAKGGDVEWSITTTALFVALGGSIASFIFALGCVGYFFWHQSTSTFLRKRNSRAILMLLFSFCISWTTTCFYRVVSMDRFPCWLLVFLVYIVNAILFAASILDVSMYMSKVARIRLDETLRMETDLDRQSLLHISFWTALYCHIQVVYLNHRKKHTVIGNLVFVSRRIHCILYISVFSLCFPIIFVIRLVQHPEWLFCTGCDIAVTDAIIILVLDNIFGTLGWISNSRQRRRNDKLRILMEWNDVMFVGLFFLNISYILYLTDPGQVQVNGVYNYRDLSVLGPLFSVYVVTVHQVFVSDRIRKEWMADGHGLISGNRGERFDEVMKDAILCQKLSRFLDDELSNEILRFLLAVDAFRTRHRRQQPLHAAVADDANSVYALNGEEMDDASSEGITMERPHRVMTNSLLFLKESHIAIPDVVALKEEAREIVERFIEFYAPLEINIASEMRTALLDRVKRDDIDDRMFDEVYIFIKEALLFDGFGRFLNFLKREAEEKHKREISITHRFAPITAIRRGSIT